MNTQNELTNGTRVSDADAGAMHKDYLRERRIERILSGAPLAVRKVRGSKRNRAMSAVVTVDSSLDTLEAETGWTPEAAASMAKECARDHRLFGPAQLYR
jgi:hypothetical protein